MRTHFLLWIGGLTLATTALGGVTLVTQAGGRTSKMYIEGNRVRIESTSVAQQKIMIFDGDKQQLIIADPTQSTYTVATPESVKAASVKLNTQLDLMKEQMKGAMEKVPPEQRKEMEARMEKLGSGERDAGNPQLKFVATGESNVVAGFKCKGYKEFNDGQLVSEGCYIPWDSGVITQKDFAAFESFGQFMSPLFSAMGAAAAGGMQTVTKLLTRYPGFPADRKPKGDSKSASPETLVSLSRGPMLPAVFAPPAGYVKSDKDPF